MPPPTHIMVIAPNGRETPIHPDDGVAIGGGQLRVGAKPRKVRLSSDIRRRINSGDLIPCTMNGAAARTIEAAAALDVVPSPHTDEKKGS